MEVNTVPLLVDPGTATIYPQHNRQASETPKSTIFRHKPVHILHRFSIRTFDVAAHNSLSEVGDLERLQKIYYNA